MESIYVGDLLPSIASYKKIIEKYDKAIKEGEFYEEFFIKFPFFYSLIIFFNYLFIRSY